MRAARPLTGSGPPQATTNSGRDSNASTTFRTFWFQTENGSALANGRRENGGGSTSRAHKDAKTRLRARGYGGYGSEDKIPKGHERTDSDPATCRTTAAFTVRHAQRKNPGCSGIAAARTGPGLEGYPSYALAIPNDSDPANLDSSRTTWTFHLRWSTLVVAIHAATVTSLS